jgi:hypothetical protein
MTSAVSPDEHHAARAAIGAHFAGRASPATETTMRAHLAGCSDCRGLYRRHHLLSRIDPAAVSAEERIGRALGFQPRRAPSFGFRSRLRDWVRTLAFPVAATAVAAIAVLVVVRPGTDVAPVARGPSAVTAQVPHLLVYRFAPGARAPELIRGSMRSGDELAFAYTNPAGRRYVAIFGVDEQRRVYWFHPAWRAGAPAPAALPAAAGPGPHELPEAIQHAIAGRRLALHALFADRAVGVDEIEAAVHTGAAGGALASRLGGDVAIIERDVDVSR